MSMWGDDGQTQRATPAATSMLGGDAGVRLQETVRIKPFMIPLCLE